MANLNNISIAIHGGADSRRDRSDKEIAVIEKTLAQAVKTGYSILKQGGSSTEAVVAAISVLEAAEHFNAGKGAALTAQEMVELDASVVDGSNGHFATVSGVRHIKHPIQLAQMALQAYPNAILNRDGAESFAFSSGIDFTEQDYFFTDESYDNLMMKKSNPDADPAYMGGSVGAIALDQFGNMAAATSSGGEINRYPGQLRYSSLVGSAIFAQNEIAAISAFDVDGRSIGPSFASDIAGKIARKEDDLAHSCRVATSSKASQIGLIAIDQRGTILDAYHGVDMYRASIDTHGSLTIKMNQDD
ncbi:isoaspartyl peptidase/L-asparaginase [Vibrio viridaestus]|uniref:Isoaspartyl peptidase/L-asparaginase n=1 Tax=Vibrio viridaestus TaxID=2487322 RepID=A0A3N9TBR6_9VIBR|nr:isoaspartyl peptidase/L-asparaginase [Vibrio viridaestus]RQW61627.1 isoaspartyl peptidase/L-asparaginase [Vibrio viridaestus]